MLQTCEATGSVARARSSSVAAPRSLMQPARRCCSRAARTMESGAFRAGASRQVRRCRACAREVREETGLHVQVGRLTGVYSDPHALLRYADAFSTIS